jgi:hypothetical protein
MTHVTIGIIHVTIGITRNNENDTRNNENRTKLCMPGVGIHVLVCRIDLCAIPCQRLDPMSMKDAER